MITWTQFERANPALAAAGRRQLYQIPIGLGFLATVRPDGGPRVHPVCPVLSDAGLHLLIVPGPKRADLRRDGRFALHSETCPPPREDDGFAVIGRAAEVTDPLVQETVRRRVLAERDGVVWPGFSTDIVFELRIERCLLTLTQPEDRAHRLARSLTGTVRADGHSGTAAGRPPRCGASRPRSGCRGATRTRAAAVPRVGGVRHWRGPERTHGQR
jgi:hypothetical protein